MGVDADDGDEEEFSRGVVTSSSSLCAAPSLGSLVVFVSVPEDSVEDDSGSRPSGMVDDVVMTSDRLGVLSVVPS